MSYNLPSFIDARNFKNVKIDNKYMMGIIITSFTKYIEFLQIAENIPKDQVYDMSVYVFKQDSTKVLKELTYYISSTSSEVKTSNTNQIDIDIIDKVKEDSKELRKKIQIDGEEVFKINFQILFYSTDYIKLQQNVKNYQSKLYSKGIFSNISNFRHLDLYKLTLPLIKNKEKILEYNTLNLTTSSFANSFLFYNKTIFDPEGIVMGYTKKENKICCIDIFKSSYLNANMCILGSSGSGKSYFTKSLIFKHSINRYNQYIFDPEGEYSIFIKNLNGEILRLGNNNVNKYVNILEIFDFEIEKYSGEVIEYKKKSVAQFIFITCNISEEKEKKYVIEAINRLYIEYGIVTIDDLYRKSDSNTIILENKIIASEKFPILNNLLEIIKNKKVIEKIKKNIVDNMSVLTKSTNVNMNSKLISFDTHDTDKIYIGYLVEYFLNLLECKFSSKRERSVIYVDEIWKYISINTQNNLANRFYKLFKTIRKNNASIIAITQDITDFFLYEDGSYGKSIINNCAFKLFFKLEYTDNDVLERLAIMDKKLLDTIYMLSKGQAILGFGSNKIIINIKLNEYEREVMEE